MSTTNFIQTKAPHPSCDFVAIHLLPMGEGLSFPLPMGEGLRVRGISLLFRCARAS